jgi:hypothetical protein
MHVQAIGSDAESGWIHAGIEVLANADTCRFGWRRWQLNNQWPFARDLTNFLSYLRHLVSGDEASIR